VSKKDSDPTLQGHTTARFPSLRQKSTFAKSVNLIEVGAVKAPAECDIAQSSQIAASQITLQSGAHHDDPDNSALPPATRGLPCTFFSLSSNGSMSASLVQRSGRVSMGRLESSLASSDAVLLLLRSWFFTMPLTRLNGERAAAS
jgi:hypothetical protein